MTQTSTDTEYAEAYAAARIEGDWMRIELRYGTRSQWRREKTIDRGELAEWLAAGWTEI